MSAQSLKIRIPEHIPTRQRRCLELLSQGKKYYTIAQEMGISEKTVDFHLCKLRARTQLESNAQLIKLAIRIHLAEVDV